MNADWNVPRTYRREWIAPLDLPDERTIEELREILAAEPCIVEAWVVGGRMTPLDGSQARESSDIALVLDAPLPGDRQTAPDGLMLPGRRAHRS